MDENMDDRANAGFGMEGDLALYNFWFVVPKIKLDNYSSYSQKKNILTVLLLFLLPISYYGEASQMPQPIFLTFLIL